jgi:two-component system, OmpR family, response regulator
MTAAAATILFAREDLSIPGAVEEMPLGSDAPGAVEDRFYRLLSRSKPDVIVLDFSGAPATGTDTILAIRQRTEIPILVVGSSDQPLFEEYRIAGAADCIAAPVDIIRLNQTIQQIIRVRSRGKPATNRAQQSCCFAGMCFYPGRNLLAGAGGANADLTSLEGRLLDHFAAKPWTLCTRSELGALLYGPEHSAGDRAIDVVVNRLRKKLVAAGGADAEWLIKTEFRRGYLLVADVEPLPPENAAPRRAIIQPAN